MTLAEPLLRWEWTGQHIAEIGARTGEHLYLTLIALTIGLTISFPLGIYCYRHRKILQPVTWFAGILYTIPSLALFALLVPYTGLSTTTAEIGLVSYTLLILIRNTVAGLDSVAPEVKEAARALGFTSRQLLWRVELPLAFPVLIAGLRIAATTTIGLVTVTALIAKGGLGYFILQGLVNSFPTPALIGALLSVVLATLSDLFLLAVQRRVAPWAASPAERAFS